jgi:hypothetical protein
MTVMSRAIAKAKLAYEVAAASSTARSVRRDRLTYLGPEKMHRLEGSPAQPYAAGAAANPPRQAMRAV